MAKSKATTRAKRPGRRKAKRRASARSKPAAKINPRAIEATLADIAHDIRTPLTGILSLSELLATSELGERERGWATAIKTTAEHLALLTSLMIDAARAQSKGLVLRRELVRPRRLAEAVAVTLAARAEVQVADVAQRDRRRPAGRRDRRCASPACRAGKSHRQRREIHRARQRPVRGGLPSGTARPHAAGVFGDRQRHRDDGCRDPAAVPAVCAGE